MTSIESIFDVFGNQTEAWIKAVSNGFRGLFNGSLDLFN